MEKPATSAAVTSVAGQTAASNLEDLPEHLILHVLSFLPTLDTISTSLVSKKLCSYWSVIPSLNFSYATFPPYNTPSSTRRSFAEFVDRTLISRSYSPLRKFYLDFIYEDRYCFHVNSWIRYAVRNHAEEIELDFFIDKCYFQEEPTLRDSDYDFHLSDVRNGRVKVLKLTRCGLILPGDMSSKRFWMMNTVSLDQVFLSDQMLEDLIGGCPNLEVFELANCYGMDTLKVCAGKLKELVLTFFYPNDENDIDLVVDCPNLVSLSVTWFAMGKFRVRNLSSLVRFHTYIGHKRDMFYTYWMRMVSVLKEVPHIRSLVVQNWWLKLVPKEVFSENFLLYNLKQLELQTGYTRYDLLGMAQLLELTPNLETLILDRLLKVDKEDESLSEELLKKPINLSISCLKEVKMKHFTCTEDEASFLALLKEQGVVLEKIVIVPAEEVGIQCVPIILRKRSRQAEDTKEVEVRP